jgi:hypothetical protein
MTNKDLHGNPLVAGPEFRMNKWQKRQAALLYHLTSLGYLKGLKKLLDDFVNGVDVTLEAAIQEGRDEFIVSERWGVRDTVANFSTYGFPALRDFQKSVNRQIAEAAHECYHSTGYNQCGRLLGELSLGWSTAEEERRFEAGMKVVGHHASWIDGAMEHRWNEAVAAIAWDEFGQALSPLPRFRVRTDVVGESGKLPPRTGVYVPQDDPYGTLQFAWTGNTDGRLFNCMTFNELGQQALAAVGRDALWADDKRLVPIVNQPKYLAAFRKLDWFKDADFLSNPVNAKRFIAGEGFTERPCKWYLVEKVDDELDEEDAGIHAAGRGTTTANRGRAEGGQPCPREGWWFTPAKANSRRHFKKDEVMPDLKTDWGATIWQWDPSQ